jgi:hypothetical protein
MERAAATAVEHFGAKVVGHRIGLLAGFPSSYVTAPGVDALGPDISIPWVTLDRRQDLTLASFIRSAVNRPGEVGGGVRSAELGAPASKA